MSELPDLLWDADTVDYIRREAQAGAEQVKALREAMVGRLLVSPDHTNTTALTQLAVVVRLHAVYLKLLRKTVFGKDAALYADEAEAALYADEEKDDW